jgi:hypothetical protein
VELLEEIKRLKTELLALRQRVAVLEGQAHTNAKWIPLHFRVLPKKNPGPIPYHNHPKQSSITLLSKTHIEMTSRQGR